MGRGIRLHRGLSHPGKCPAGGRVRRCFPDPLRHERTYGPAVPRPGGQGHLLPFHRLRPCGPGKGPGAGYEGVQRGLSAQRRGKLCYYADADEPAEGWPYPEAWRSAGLLPEGQDRPGYFQLHRRRYWHRPHWPDGAEASVRLWLQPAGLRPVPQPGGKEDR